MKNEEIIKKAVEKVVRALPNKHLDEWSVNAFIDKDDKFRCSDIEIEDINNIIFLHRFAKSFWGEEWNIPSPTGGICIDGRNEIARQKKGEPWQYHLQQIVILDDDERIKYLEQFLK